MMNLIGKKIKSCMLDETNTKKACFVYTKKVVDVVDVDAKSIDIHFEGGDVINLEPDQYIRLVDDGISYVPNFDGSYFDVECLIVE
jgi:argininosuccinate synthase